MLVCEFRIALNSSTHLFHSIQIVYDYWDLGGTGQWLNGDCVLKGATVGVCLYSGIGSTVHDGVYASVNHPGFFNT